MASSHTTDRADIESTSCQTDSSEWQSDFVTSEEEKTDSSDSDYLP